MKARQPVVNTVIASIDMPMLTSATPKNDHRNPLIRYTTGLNRVIACQTGGSMVIE